ncbi:hypothetical protein [Slackia heliotrinireducens]|uniref:ornithine cyclodeaminase family domain n=1 Tax=Slackia heliotrinireducens TaxID=84110 RepID=UPI003314F012
MAFALNTYMAPDFECTTFENAPDVVMKRVAADGVAPENYHAMSIFPEYFKIDGQWHLAEESRMDCVPVWEDGRVHVREFRHLRVGDLVICGRQETGEEGIYVHPDGFRTAEAMAERFAFRQNRSRETAYSKVYDDLYELLKYERDNGYIVWVMGPAFAFNGYSREAFARVVEGGYAHAVLAGNALATHDLEAAYLGTALGQDVNTQMNMAGGHYNHLDTINKVRESGSIGAFIHKQGIDNGIMHALETRHVPYVLAGSIRDDGPLPGVYGDAYAAQDAMREHVSKATTVICMASMLHSVATGNMTPSFRVLPDGTVRQVYFYCVDIAEFVVNKLVDRGSLASKGIVTNAQDFIGLVAKGLDLL